MNNLISASDWKIAFHIFSTSEKEGHAERVYCVWIGGKEVTPSANWWNPVSVP